MKELACEIDEVVDQVQNFKSITKTESTKETPLNCESWKARILRPDSFLHFGF